MHTRAIRPQGWMGEGDGGCWTYEETPYYCAQGKTIIKERDTVGWGGWLGVQGRG